jgi:hypothetical protein
MQTDVARWNELFLACVAKGNLGPTVTARAMHIAHTAIYDAWAAFDPVAVGVNSRIEAPSALTTAQGYIAAQEEAIAYAAFTAAVALFPAHVDVIRSFMQAQGYNPDAVVTGHDTAAAIGLDAARAVLDYAKTDFSNAANNFADTTGYVAVNSADPAAPNAPGGPDFDPNQWQPLRVPTGVVANLRGEPVATSNPASYRNQNPLTPQFGEVKSFSLQANDEFRPKAPPILWNFSEYIDGNGKVTTNDAAYREQFADVLAISGTLTDRQKAIAEFWADGPRSETPPGHWNQLAQDVAYRDGNTLDDDVKLFFALNNALFDAAIATWETKFHYNSIRPQSAIRDLYFDQEVQAWIGPDRGLGTILGQNWTPYQQATFVTPPFPEYTSGHSAFSMAAATILKLFTGSDVFYDGVSVGDHDLNGDGQLDLAGQYIVSRLAFEDYSGPPIALTWETFTEAAEEAAVSRRYGGIHIQDGDLFARVLGANVGNSAWDASLRYLSGSPDALVHSPTGTSANDLLIGSDRPETFDAGSGNDVIRPNGGGDVVTLGAGIDRIEGYALSLNDLHVRDLSAGDSIVFIEGIDAASLNIRVTGTGALIGTGAQDIVLDGNFTSGRFLVNHVGDDTIVTFVNGVRLSASLFTGGFDAQDIAESTIPAPSLSAFEALSSLVTASLTM